MRPARASLCLAAALTLATSAVSGANPEVTVALPGAAEMAFVWIEPGSFVMGSPESDEPRWETEGPQHRVTLTRGYWLGKYEVTQGQWSAVMGTCPWDGQANTVDDARSAASYITWEDAQDLVGTLNCGSVHYAFRLPTEAEWEYASRAGTTTQWPFGDDPADLDEYAWHRANAWDVGERYPHAVGTRRANPWGLHDMHGNLWEWCQDWFGAYGVEPQVDPTGPANGEVHVFRGGAFYCAQARTRCAHRGGIAPAARGNRQGLRLVLEHPLGVGAAGTQVREQTWGMVRYRIGHETHSD